MTDSIEDLFLPPQDKGSPGGQVYLYRLLRLLASLDTGDLTGLPVNYENARRLAPSMGLNSPERLTAFFNHAGLGSLKLDIGDERIEAGFTPAHTPSAPARNDCELERGIIDGALELITGLPVTTRETGCWNRGNGRCSFEASRDRSASRDRYIPVPSPGANCAGMGPVFGRGGDSSRLSSWYMDLAARELARTRRHDRQLAVLCVDIDDLGKINASMGREAGDQLIGAIAAAISKECRTEDYLWYPGEDEFVLILAETGVEHAEAVAQRLIAGITSETKHSGLDMTASASIGLAVFPTHADSLPDLIASAKSALYLAKSLGKGRVQIAKGQSTSGTASKITRHPGRRSAAREDHAKKSVQAAAVGAETSPAPNVPLAQKPAAGPGSTRPATGGSVVGPEEAPAKTISVLLASTSPLLAAGITNVLSASPEMEIIEDIHEPGRVAAAVLDLRPDLIISDAATATANGFAVPDTLRENNLPCKYAVLASDVDADLLQLAADYSPDGIIMQQSSPEEILAALEAIYRGKRVYPEEVQSALSELEDNRRLLEELSEREVEVLRLVAEGKSNSQISEELFITVNTVRFHLANVYQKLGVGNRTEAANYYLRQDFSSETQPKLL